MKADQDAHPTQLRERLEVLLADAAANRHEIERVLRALVATGDPAGIELALDLMGDRGLRSPSTFWSELFADTDDSRIGTIARRVLEANLAQHLTSWVHTQGYTELMATKGSAEEAAALVEMLTTKNLNLSSETIASLAGKISPEPLLDVLAQGTSPFAAGVAEGLAGWNDPAVTARMWDLTTEPGIGDASREALLRGLAFHTPSEDVESYLSRYWSLPSSAERTLFLEALGYVAKSDGGLPPGSIGSLVTIVEHGLSATTFAERSAALYRIEYDDALHTQRMLQCLRAMESATVAPEELARIRQTIGRVEFALGDR